MKITAADFARIRRSLLVCIACGALGAAAAWLAQQHAADAAAANRRAQAQGMELRALLDGANAEATASRALAARYRAMATRGIVGPERRLDWVERMAQIKAARRLGALSYELAPQRSALLPGGGTADGDEFMASTMKVQLSLLHEDDLLGFLADLTDGIAAFPRVRSCNVERIGAPSDAAARLHADCTIDWITLQEKT